MDRKNLEIYISSISEILLNDALEIKKLSEKDNSEFYEGKRLAYYEVLTTIKNQAKIYDIHIKELEKFNLDRNIA
jgi:hypothetical protein